MLGHEVRCVAQTELMPANCGPDVRYWHKYDLSRESIMRPLHLRHASPALAIAVLLLAVALGT